MNKEQMKYKKFIERKAKKIASLEKKLDLGEDVKLIQDEIDNIMSTLSLQDMLEIDDYIIKKNLLTK